MLIFLKLNLNQLFKKIFNIKGNISVAPRSQKMPGGISVEEIQETLSTLSQDKNFILKQVFKDCIMIDQR